MNYDYTKQKKRNTKPFWKDTEFTVNLKKVQHTGFCAYKAHTVCYMCIVLCAL